MLDLLNKIHCQDNGEILAQLPDKSLNLILEDMPYNTTNCEFEYAVDLEKYWQVRLPKLKDNAVVALTAQFPFSAFLAISNLKFFKYSLVWNKRIATGFLNAKKQPLRQHEDILIFYGKQPTFNPQMHTNKLKRNFEKLMSKKPTQNYGKQRDYVSTITEKISYPRSIIEQTGVVNNSREKVKHPTQKPVELFSWLIRTYTNAGDLVFDGFGGSGTTAISCVKEKRNFIVCEWNEDYHELAQVRLANEQHNLLSSL